MKIDNLIIRACDFNIASQDVDLIKTLYSLTLYGGKKQSGITYELDVLSKVSKTRMVDAVILTAIKNEQIVGWALLSRELSNFKSFNHQYEWFNPFQHGTLFEVYVKLEFRRMGIATELIKVARRKAQPHPLCLVPWDYVSEKFFSNFKHYNHTII